MKLALTQLNEIDKIQFPPEIMLYENAGFIEKSNKMKTNHVSGILREAGFRTLDLSLWEGEHATEIVQSKEPKGDEILCRGEYKGWNIESVKEYEGYVPATILRNMASLVNKDMLYVLYPQASDPVLVYELPYIGSNRRKTCVILAEWE